MRPSRGKCDFTGRCLMGRNAPGPSWKVSKCYAAGASGWRLLYPYERNICGGALANAATLLQIQPHEESTAINLCNTWQPALHHVNKRRPSRRQTLKAPT
ncbi:hypothetical protein CGMCC3_g1336 [Colletotrichum fructicola]|nr:uncharacterized protein CGMCC3_g1336 [Colletotrichum fructicola]KAE9582161.1 hypothetical protein CGMCC3_g1336 [Colletotrichum fructicola]